MGNEERSTDFLPNVYWICLKCFQKWYFCLALEYIAFWDVCNHVMVYTLPGYVTTSGERSP